MLGNYSFLTKYFQFFTRFFKMFGILRLHKIRIYEIILGFVLYSCETFPSKIFSERLLITYIFPHLYFVFSLVKTQSCTQDFFKVFFGFF